MIKFYNFLFFLFLIFVSGRTVAQSQFQDFINYVNSLSDPAAKTAAVDSFMNYARSQGIPFIESNTANYIFRGPYSSVEVAGDFDEFSDYLDLTSLSGTNFFYRSEQYELNARLDYEFRLNGSMIINDPENPDSIPGYYGYHSELAMPEYIQPLEIQFDPSIDHGTVIETSLYSTNVSRTYQIKIYLPPAYHSSLDSLPVAYFQDGFSYIDWGSSINVLDNLIAKDKIQPVIAVFVNPTNRNSEYAFFLRNAYRLFFVNELVPFIDSNYRTLRYPSKRLVLGDSYGGNISALISYNHPDVFGLCGLHSAAFNPNDYEAYNLITNGEVRNIKFSNIWGSYDDRNSNLVNFNNILISKGYEIDWLVLPEGHSWGFWRATIDTMLQFFFPPQINDEKQVTINTQPAGLEFIVDSANYNSQQVFNWASGSVHTIGTISPQNQSQNVRYVWDNWSDNDSLVHNVLINNDTTFTAAFSTEYFVDINYSNGGSVTPSDQWISSGSTLQVEAFPDSGYQFSEWIGTGNASYSGTLNPATINVLGPITQLAVFTITPIEAPSNLSGQIYSNPVSLQLFWQDNSTNELGFIIEKENQAGDAFIIVDSVAANITDYLDSNVTYITYNYRVKAFNSLTVSEYSDTLQIQIPVELISFSAQVSSNKVDLLWQTASEINNYGFEIERSLMADVFPGKEIRNWLNWQNIGFVPGTGTTSEKKNYIFTDRFTDNMDCAIRYRLKQVDLSGSFSYSNELLVEPTIPAHFSLEQNYPNPFNPTTKIIWQSPVSGHQSLIVYDLLGRQIITLVDEFLQAGKYEFLFTASDLASGVYFIKFSTHTFQCTKKIVLQK